MTERGTTWMGGPDRAFRTTIWSDILAAQDRSNPQWQQKLGGLCQAYWKPVYAYIRVAWNKPVEEAKDLTQAFFARFLEKDYLSRLRPELGSFRGYLKRALQHFLINAKEAALSAQGHRRVFSLDASPDELGTVGVAAPQETPERVYDREWFRCLIHAAIGELRASLKAEGKDIYFEVFRAYCLEPGKEVLHEEQDQKPSTYRAIAAGLGLQETDVRNYLSYSRRVLKEIVRARIRDYVANEDEVEGELRQAAGS